MKKSTFLFLFALQFIIMGLNYNAGSGIKGCIQLENKMYLGVGVSNLGFPEGTQNYKSSPLYFAADMGYRFGNELFGLTPYPSIGDMIINMSSQGVYGSPSDISYSKLAFGGGLFGTISINNRFSVGLNYRMYPLGSGKFFYGDGVRTIPHGFSSSVFF